MSNRRLCPRWFAPGSYSGLAILLIVFAFVDLGTEKPCCADELGLPFPSVSSHETARADHGYEHAHASAPTTDDRSPAHSESGPEDCFCCAVSMPATPIAVDAPLGRDPAADPHGIALPSASPRPHYHPPRSA